MRILKIHSKPITPRAKLKKMTLCLVLGAFHQKYDRLFVKLTRVGYQTLDIPIFFRKSIFAKDNAFSKGFILFDIASKRMQKTLVL